MNRNCYTLCFLFFSLIFSTAYAGRPTDPQEDGRAPVDSIDAAFAYNLFDEPSISFLFFIGIIASVFLGFGYIRMRMGSYRKYLWQWKKREFHS